MISSNGLSYNWSIHCFDEIGNEGNSSAWNFSISTTNYAPTIVLNSPDNDTLYDTSFSATILNATITDANGDWMKAYFFANENNNGLNLSDGLVYIKENIASGTSLTYNISALPISPSEDELVLLMHFDNRSEFGENDTLILGLANSKFKKDPILYSWDREGKVFCEASV